ncbi:MAG: hypothetical protein WAZ27_02230 [Minisyncoccia bacterium]
MQTENQKRFDWIVVLGNTFSIICVPVFFLLGGLLFSIDPTESFDRATGVVDFIAIVSISIVVAWGCAYLRMQKMARTVSFLPLPIMIYLLIG